MATDYVELDNVSGGSKIACDDDGTGLWQYAKMAFGADGTQTVVTSIDTTPLPVQLSTIDNAVLDTINTAVEANETLLGTIDTDTSSMATDLGTIDADTGAIKTAVEGTLTVDGSGVTQPVSIAGTVTVDVVAALPAGTNAIGKLAANTGIDIGDVDVTSTSIDGSINGPEEPSIDSYLTITINKGIGVDAVLVSSFASKQIWIYGYAFVCGTADGTSVSLQDEDDTELTGTMVFAQYGGISVPPSGNFAMPVHKLDTDKDLEIDIGGGEVDGWLTYAIVSV